MVFLTKLVSSMCNNNFLLRSCSISFQFFIKLFQTSSILGVLKFTIAREQKSLSRSASTWCLQASQNTGLPRHFLNFIQASVMRPVLHLVVSKTITLMLFTQFHFKEDSLLSYKQFLRKYFSFFFLKKGLLEVYILSWDKNWQTFFFL